MKFLVKFDLEFDLKFEISNGKILVNFWGEEFSTCQESTGNFGENFRANFGANFGEHFGNFVSNFATFFGSFVQQKGGAKEIAVPKCKSLAIFHSTLQSRCGIASLEPQHAKSRHFKTVLFLSAVLSGRRCPKRVKKGQSGSLKTVTSLN